MQPWTLSGNRLIMWKKQYVPVSPIMISIYYIHLNTLYFRTLLFPNFLQDIPYNSKPTIWDGFSTHQKKGDFGGLWRLPQFITMCIPLLFHSNPVMVHHLYPLLMVKFQKLS